MLALTRAEIVQRMRAPVVTQAEGLVRVFANCPEDMRREFQRPVARFAAETVYGLYRGLRRKPERFESPRIIVHLGDVRTNVASVVTRVATNEDASVTTRIYLKSPGGADISRFRREVARAFYRAVLGRELSEAEAVRALQEADPSYRVSVLRKKLEAWLAGDRSEQKLADDEAWDEEHLTLMRKVLEVGVASRRDVQTFASRLFLYPPIFGDPFEGGLRELSFREAIPLAKKDPRIRLLATRKAMEVAVFGAGRGEAMSAAAEAYVGFLKDLSLGETSEKDLSDALTNADKCLEMAWEGAER